MTELFTVVRGLGNIYDFFDEKVFLRTSKSYAVVFPLPKSFTQFESRQNGWILLLLNAEKIRRYLASIIFSFRLRNYCLKSNDPQTY